VQGHFDKTFIGVMFSSHGGGQKGVMSSLSQDGPENPSGKTSRRNFLRIAGIAGLTAGAIKLIPFINAQSREASRGGRWSDPQTWGGKAPSSEDVVRITSSVVLDKDAEVAGIVVESNGRLIFPRKKSRTIKSRGNVVVKGRLVMRPKSANVKHKLLFVGIDEGKFVGGGMDVLDPDVGLWVMGKGRLDLAGSPKTAWTRAAGSIAAGATSIELQETPTGWRKGDEVVVAPTLDPTNPDHYSGFDVSAIASVEGKTVTLARPTGQSHPVVDIGDATYSAEILNLSRNVQIEGAPNKRSHIFIRSRRSQTIRNAAIRHMGPRQGESLVQGRYGLHFHMSGNGSRGSTVDGVVVRECGSHCFVPHLSNGVTFRDCIAYDAWQDAYWWDPLDSLTHDIVWTHCVAALVRVAKGQAGFYQVTGFNLQDGDRNVCKDCVAVGIGVDGAKSSSGFLWPSKGPTVGVWEFENCIAHNNAANGIFAWQNDSFDHVISRFTAYHNGKAGIEHGAYKNRYLYEDIKLFGSGEAALYLHANSTLPKNGGGPLRFTSAVLDGAGISPASVFIAKHAKESDQPVELRDCTLRGFSEVPVRIDDQSKTPGLQDFIRCSVQPGDRDLTPSDFDIVSMAPGGQIRVQSRDNQSAFKLDHTGNAQEIPPFA
jgi:hypothetical protein